MRTLVFRLLLAVVAIELVLRAAEFATGHIIPEARRLSFAEQKSFIGVPHTETHPVFGYTYPKGLRGLTDRYTLEPTTLSVTTNAHGFRTHEFYPKLPGDVRILLLGDSFIGGNNANQGETPAVVLERLLRSEISERVEVLSLGVPSYSAVVYAVLIRSYIEFLDPDFVVVAVDQSDFDEDVRRIELYETDANGAALYLREARRILREKRLYRIAIDETRREHKLAVSEAFLKLRAASSIVNVGARLVEGLAERAKQRETQRVATELESRAGRTPGFRYTELSSTERADWSDRIPARLAGDTLAVDFETALGRYEPTLTSLRYIATECAQRDVGLWLVSYPYPWNVSLVESVPYQVRFLGGTFDLRGNRVHPQLLDHYAGLLGVPHLNAYPVFEVDTKRKFGKFDQHFNAYGYTLFARFLYDEVADAVRGRVEASRVRGSRAGV